MAHYVICKYCGVRFNRDIEDVYKIGNRYAHTECAILHETTKSKEEQDKENLEKYIKELFNLDYITPKIAKQIKTFKEEYKYGYSGILKTLKYYYEIKNGSKEKANQGIGIVPYLYLEAYNYYQTIEKANEKNDLIKIEDIKTKEVFISPQKRIGLKKNAFSFLDKEGD